MQKLDIKLDSNMEGLSISLGTWQDPTVFLPKWADYDLQDAIVEALQWAYAQGRLDESLQHQPKWDITTPEEGK